MTLGVKISVKNKSLQVKYRIYVVRDCKKKLFLHPPESLMECLYPCEKFFHDEKVKLPVVVAIEQSHLTDF